MRPHLILAGSALLALLLACASPAPNAHSVAAPDRVGAAGFSIDVPPGRSWDFRRTDFSVTLERRGTSWWRAAESVLICVSKHPLAALGLPIPERELAARFFDAEKAILLETEAEEDVSSMVQQEWSRQGRTMYRLIYDIHSRYRSDDPAWGADVLHQKGEIYAYYPDGALGSHFYCFEIRATRRQSYPGEVQTLRMIDRVIDSFRREEPARAPAPANLQSR
jgi:hypothetical protein